jgi:hypothetical protein
VCVCACVCVCVHARMRARVRVWHRSSSVDQPASKSASRVLNATNLVTRTLPDLTPTLTPHTDTLTLSLTRQSKISAKAHVLPDCRCVWIITLRPLL